MSVNSDYYPWTSVFPGGVIESLKTEKDKLSLIAMLVEVTWQAIAHYQEGDYGSLDALVGNYGCEVHAFNMLSLACCDKLKLECQSMRDTCQSILELIKSRRTPGKKDPFQGFLEKLNSIATVSSKMKYLIQSRLLTVTKEFLYSPEKFGQRDYETLKTDPCKLRKMARLSVQDDVLKKIVAAAQSSMSESAIQLLRTRLDSLALASSIEGDVVKTMMTEEFLCSYDPFSHMLTKGGVHREKTFSCSYYNTKALLMLVAELKAPLIIKKMTMLEEPVKTFAFSHCEGLDRYRVMTQEEIELYPKDAPVVVCVVYLPELISDEEWLKKVHYYGLGAMILAYSAQGSQYVPNKPEILPGKHLEIAEEEIQMQAFVKAKELECVVDENPVFDLDHFYCSTWGHREENLGEVVS